MEEIIQLLVYAVLIYLIIGVLFSFFFYHKGMSKIDEIATGSTIGFKLIAFPGIVVFWPFLLGKWLKQK